MPLTSVPQYSVGGLEQSVLGNGGNPLAIPASATTQTIFTVNSGYVHILELFGVVTTVIGGTVTNLKISAVPTVGSSTDVCANGAITSLAVGNIVMPITSFATALSIGSTPGVLVALAPTQWVQGPGTIIITTSANAGGGAFQWYCRYRPLTPGAFVS